MSSLFTKEEMLKMIKHLCDEFEGASITQNKKRVIEACRELIALLSNYIDDPEIRLGIKKIITLKTGR